MGEVVVLSWASYRSRAHHDEVLARARDDPWHAQLEAGDLPFNTRRMFFGGFEQVIAFPDTGDQPPRRPRAPEIAGVSRASG
jgi:uncharacterized protein YbaA (DUF1428 family)